MIISRTPFRISFFGGGTDYPGYFKNHPGAVLATTIDKYCYITVRQLPPFFDHKHRIVYSKMERVTGTDEIEHPSVRECLKFMNVTHGVEIHHDSDLPARSGLGSSSSFTVGLLKALYAMQGKIVDSAALFRSAIHVEQDIIHENVGCQDQATAAFGGFNHITFSPQKLADVHPVIAKPKRLEDLCNHLLLFFTGVSRNAHEVAAEQIQNIPRKTNELQDMYRMVGEALKIVGSDGDLLDFGRLLHEAWTLKKSLSSKISSSSIDDVYKLARKSGAVGGKLLGAGGGGFFLVFAKPEDHTKIRFALGHLLYVPFRFESTGSQIIFYQADLLAA